MNSTVYHRECFKWASHSLALAIPPPIVLSQYPRKLHRFLKRNWIKEDDFSVPLKAHLHFLITHNDHYRYYCGEKMILGQEFQAFP